MGSYKSVVSLMIKTFDQMLVDAWNDLVQRIVNNYNCRSLERDLERLKADHATEVNIEHEIQKMQKLAVI